MKKYWLIGTTALALAAGCAWAEDKAATAPAGAMHEEHMMGMGGGDYVPYKDLTLEQAREHAHKHAEKLDKMTPQEWDEHKKKVMERHEKWKAMTPEEREKHRAEMREHRMHKMEGTGAGTGTPAKTDGK